WHDPAGLTILLICLFGLWGLSLLMLRSSTQPPQPAAVEKWRGGSIPVSLLLGLTCWMVVAELAVQGWYYTHQSAITATRWRAQWPEQQHNYKTVPIPPPTQAILRYDDGGGAAWNSSDMRHWMMYFFRWLPVRTAALFVKIHR